MYKCGGKACSDMSSAIQKIVCYVSLLCVAVFDAYLITVFYSSSPTFCFLSIMLHAICVTVLFIENYSLVQELNQIQNNQAEPRNPTQELIFNLAQTNINLQKQIDVLAAKLGKYKTMRGMHSHSFSEG